MLAALSFVITSCHQQPRTHSACKLVGTGLLQARRSVAMDLIRFVTIFVW